jgi:hypothetical protein
MTPKTTEEIDAEKASKPARERVPPDFRELAAISISYGMSKHGLDETGQGTYAVPGNEQARIGTHMRSMLHHLDEVLAGHHVDQDVTEPDWAGRIMHWHAFFAQASIVARLLRRPVGEVHEHDRRFYPKDWLP